MEPRTLLGVAVLLAAALAGARLALCLAAAARGRRYPASLSLSQGWR